LDLPCIEDEQFPLPGLRLSPRRWEAAGLHPRFTPPFHALLAKSTNGEQAIKQALNGSGTPCPRRQDAARLLTP